MTFQEIIVRSLVYGSVVTLTTIVSLFAQSGDFAQFESKELSCIIGNNSESGNHRSGYNGIFSLVSIHQQKPLFVPAYAGLNLEHIFHPSLDIDNRDFFFEPRNAPMEFTRIDDKTALLYQPPTPQTGVESWTTFTLVDPYYIDVEFRCKPHQLIDDSGAIGFFWASYINEPDDKSIYFLKDESTADHPHWQQFCTQYHNHDSTVRSNKDLIQWGFPAELTGKTLFTSHSRVSFGEPFYYGRFENMVWAMMFRESEGIRFSHSPSGGGRTIDGSDSNPAWDFQWIIPDYSVGGNYSLHYRILYKTWSGRNDILHEYQSFKSTSP